MKVLTASRYPGGVNTIVPPIKRLIQDREKVIVISHRDISARIFEQNNIPYRVWSKDVSVTSMIELLLSEKPDLVLIGTADLAGKTFEGDVIDKTITMAAKAQGIKTLAVLDSHINSVERFSDIVTGETFKFLPDKIAIADEITLQIMKKEGFDSRWLEVTGNPHFDNLATKAKNFSETKKQSVREEIGLDDVEFLIFYAGNVFKNEAEATGYWDLDIIKIISEVMSSVPDMNVGTVIKLHPEMYRGGKDEDRALILSHIKDYGKIKIVKDFDSQNLSLASDLTVSTFSTVLVEAAYMKLCLSLQPGLKFEEDPLLISASGIVAVGYNEKDCLVQLKKMITEPSYREMWAKKASSFKADGKATERVVNLIHKMVRGEP